MRGGVEIHGLEPRQGETAFAFLVLRLTRPMQRAELVEVVRHVAPMIPDAEAILAGFSDELDEEMQLVGVPWTPPEQGGVGEQRALIEGAAARGVEAAWFFQTGTSLPPIEDEVEGDDGDDSDDGGHEDHGSNGESTNGAGEARFVAEPSLAKLAASTDDSWDDLFPGDVTDPHTPQLHLEKEAGEDDDEDDADESDEDDADESDEDDEDEEDEEDETWSHGPPPQRTEVPFPVEGYPAILDELDWEDFGISFKLAGPFTPGEGTVLLGFHALWLAPYGGRYRNAAVTIDRRHHAAHLWVDRFAVPSSPEEQVGHLLWVLSKLHEVTPVLHARFGGATMSQKYAGLLGDSSEPFVLGGNPLLAIYEESGESGVDLWIAEQTDWSADEVAQMLREIADRIMEGDDEGEEEEEEEEEVDDGEVEEDGEDEAEDEAVAELDEDELAEEVDEDDEDDDEDEDDDDDDDLGRDITTYAGELLIARARAGLLDARAAESLRPLLAITDTDDPDGRRTAAIGLLGALRDRASVPALIQLLEERRNSSAPDANDPEELLAETASALGAIGDPSAIPALARLVAAPGPHGDGHRPAAAAALAACLAAAPEPRDVDDAVVGALLDAIRERADDELHAELTVAYGQLARQLPPPRRDDVRRRLAETEPACDDVMAKLARHAALVLASSGGPLDAGTAAAMRPLLHAALTELAADHASTVRNIRTALRVAELLPELVAPADLIALTRLPEPDVRERAHALLERLHHGMQPARCFDPLAVRELPEGELVERLGDPHVVGRAALAGEIARRGLHGGRSAVCAAVQDAVERAPSGEQRLLAPDARLLEVAIPWLREGELDDATIALFDRILRHGNPHVKWDLLEEPPEDARLLGGMFYVLSERWSWQEEAARDWLRGLEGTAAFEAARRRAGVASLDPDDEDDDEDEDDEDREDDEEMN